MPACSCQHFQSGSNVVPSPPPRCELMRQGAEDGGASLCWNGGGAKSGWMATTGLFTRSLPGSTQRECLTLIQGTKLAPWRRPGCHTHPLLLLPGRVGLSATACRNIYAKGNSLSPLLLWWVPKRSKGESQADDAVHQCIWYLLTAVLKLVLIQDQCH